MTENNFKITKTHLIIGAVVLVIILFFVFSNKPVAKQTPDLQEQSVKEIKNSSEGSTTNAMDAQSAYLKEESARKKQRDIDREKCIADAEQKQAEQQAEFRQDPQNGLFTARAFLSNVDEEIDRCYFRFPNN